MPEENRHNHVALFLEIFVFLLALVFFYFVRNIVAIFIVALIIASAVTMWAAALRRRIRIPYHLGVVLIYALFLGLITLVAYAILPQVFAQLKALPQTISAIAKDVVFTSPTLKSFREYLQPILQNLQQYAGAFSPVIANAFGGVFSAVIIFVISFYLSFEEKGVERLIKLVSPKRYWDYVLFVWNTSQKKFAAWLFAQFILMASVGLLVFLVLTLLKVPQAAPVALLAGLLEIIPFFGPVISGIIAVLFALSVSVDLAFWTLLSFIAIQQIENHVAQPLLLRRSIQMHPVLVILAILAGGAIGGFLGILIAVPLTSVVIELNLNPPKPKEGQSSD